MTTLRPNISFFVPAYNEEKNIAKVIEQADRVLKETTSSYEIIIVNDGSTDNTGKIADELARDNSTIRVIHHCPNQGYGAAVVTGIRAATKDYIFFTDADLQFDIQELKRLIEYIPEYQVVLGVRTKRKDPFLRLINAKGWNILNRILFGLQVQDIDCAFKLFKKEALDSITIKSRGAMVSAEILTKLQRKKIPFKEVPVTHFAREFGSPTGAKLSVIFKAFRELSQLYYGEPGTINHKQIVKFIIVGSINTCIDLLSYVFFTRFFLFFNMHRVTAKIFSFGLGTISSFTLNRTWTFKIKKRPTILEIIQFYIMVGSGLMLNALIMYFFVHIIVINDILAAIIATIFSFMWNFLLSKFWVFKVKLRVD